MCVVAGAGAAMACNSVSIGAQRTQNIPPYWSEKTRILVFRDTFGIFLKYTFIVIQNIFRYQYHIPFK